MGLAERRAVKEFQENDLPKLTAEVCEVAGFEVPINVAWQELAIDGAAENYKPWWTDIFFKPLIASFRQITRDEMGKDALKEGLKRIELRNSGRLWVPNEAIKFEAGVLTIDHDLTNVDDVDARTSYLVELIESKV